MTMTERAALQRLRSEFRNCGDHRLERQFAIKHAPAGPYRLTSASINT